MARRQVSVVPSHCNAGYRNSEMQKEEYKFLWLSRAACFLVLKLAPTTASDKVIASMRPEFCFQDGEGVLAVFFKCEKSSAVNISYFIREMSRLKSLQKPRNFLTICEVVGGKAF